jgi:large subunit ribosomal protein L16
MVFEIEGVPLEVAKEAMRLGAQKLPIQTKFVTRRDFVEEIIA